MNSLTVPTEMHLLLTDVLIVGCFGLKRLLNALDVNVNVLTVQERTCEAGEGENGILKEYS